MDNSYTARVAARAKDELAPMALAEAADHFGTDNEDELTVVSADYGHTIEPGGGEHWDATFVIARG